MYSFEIAALFHHLQGKEKIAAISKVEFSFPEWSRSYILVALVASRFFSKAKMAAFRTPANKRIPECFCTLRILKPVLKPVSGD